MSKSSLAPPTTTTSSSGPIAWVRSQGWKRISLLLIMLLGSVSLLAAAATLAFAGPPFLRTDRVGDGRDADARRRAGNRETGWETRYTATGVSEVAAAAATALTSSPTSFVPGKAFDRLAIIYFENQNYEKAAGDANFAWFRSRGVTLSNYMAVTHPSQPNYMASIGGDYFGMHDDDFHRAPANVSTVLDLLDTRNISWAHYEEDMPYSGFEGLAWIRHADGANDYVRKHNPAVQFDSVASDPLRLARLKNLSLADPDRSLFHRDLRAGTLPQWLFITPNMTSDGHDSSVTTAGAWCRAFLEPLLNDNRFMQRTLVLVTWDENETYASRNRILGILLGDALDPALAGYDDGHLYSHYSQIATVSANWDLPTLGRWDVGANVFEVVARQTGDQLSDPDPDLFAARAWNESYAGPLHKHARGSPWPAPNLDLDADSTRARRPILPAVKATWAGSSAPSYYQDTVTVPDGMHPPNGYAPRRS